MATKALVFLLVVASLFPQQANAQAAKAEKATASQSISSLSDDLAALESTVGINPAQQGSVEERLATLEYRLLGSAQSGSLVARIDRLKKARKQSASKSSDQGSLTNKDDTKLKGLDPAVGKIINLLPLANAMNVTFVRIEPAGEKPDLTGDYFAKVMQATKGRVVRFKQMPIPVYVAPVAERSYMQACVRAFEMWEEHSEGLVKFVQVDKPQSARIKVVWNHLGVNSNPADCNLGAHTVTSWQPASGAPSASGKPLPLLGGSGKYNAHPQTIEVNLDLLLSKDEDVRERLLRNIVAHELGHAMGILTHSPIKTDLMYSVTDECSRISQRDINTLQKLYGFKPDIAL